MANILLKRLRNYMDSQELLSLLEELKNLAEIGVKPDIRQSYRAFGLGDRIISFQGPDKIKKLDNVIEIFLQNNHEIHKTVSSTMVAESIINIIKESLLNGVEITKNTVNTFYETLLSMPVEEWEVLRYLFGVKISSNDPVRLGPFTIYDWEKHISIIDEKYPHAHLLNQIELAKVSKSILIGVKIVSRDHQRALELADIKFIKFENVLRYMIANRSGHCHIGIFEYRGRSFLEAITVSQSRSTSSAQGRGAYYDVDVDMPFITDQSHGHDRIWALLEKPELNEMEKRIISTIEWVGKGINDLDDANAFIQYIFAIEALLTYSDKTVVTPSIMSQISEASAFIIENTYEKREELDRLVRKLYERRSAIAHSGIQKVTTDELQKALWLVKKLIIKMTTNDELKKMSSIEQLIKWVRQKKYS